MNHANTWLSEFIFAAYNTPPAERRRFVAFIDELPLFRASAQLLSDSVTQVRKFRLHFVTAHAGTQFFENGIQDKLLNAVTSACRVHAIFRHQNEVDATYFAKLVKLPELSAQKVKHVLRQPMQFHDGNDLVTLIDTADNWQQADQQGGADADATTDTTTNTAGTTDATTATRTKTEEEETLRRTVGDAHATVTGRNSSTAQASGRTRTSTANWAKTQSQGGSRTFKQTLVPRIVVRDVVTSIQFLTTEEKLTEGASGIAGQDTGEALLYIAGKGTLKVQFPLPQRPFRGTPKFARKKLAQLWALVSARPEYALPQEIAAQRAAFLQQLATYLTALADARQGRAPLALPSAIPALPDVGTEVPPLAALAHRPDDSPLAI